jgi:O-6-methylguanine DNA methyltransferase
MVNETLLWNAVSALDAHWDGVFVYAVPSTRVYCRPTCPSRRPRREAAPAPPNPVALLVPCHRAVRESGDLGGYHWGVARKRKLLERERAG